MKAEIRLGVIYHCSCGHQFDGLVVTRLGEENKEIFLERVKRAGEEVAREVVEKINAVLADCEKQEIIEDFGQHLVREGQGLDWRSVVGHEFHQTACPHCHETCVGNDTHRYYFFV